MNDAVLTMTPAGTPAGTPAADAATARWGDGWWLAALALPAIRFTQGFIFWGGGSRRLIYAPQKLDPHAASWMANKFQSAMPGALFGTDHVIAFLLQHFYLLYASIILFSVAELVFGLLLMLGVFSRLSALVTIGFSLLLMPMYGWQGATCIDEWTMAAANFAMGTTLLLAGGGAWSVDRVLLRRTGLGARAWFRWAGGATPLPLSARAMERAGLGALLFTIVFVVGFYNYYRGAVLTPFHGGPVSAAAHHVGLSQARLSPDGTVRVRAYLDGGTPAVPAHIVAATLTDAKGAVVERWDMHALASLSPAAIANVFAYQRFRTGPYGLIAPVGAMADITLPPEPAAPGALAVGSYRLVFSNVSGRRFSVAVRLPAGG